MQNKYLQYGSALLAALLLAIAVAAAWNGGRARTQAKVIMQNADQVAQALAYFFADQGRYPTAVEFSDKDVFGIYLVPFPPVSFVSENCAQSFVYKNPVPKSYSLAVCLPRAFAGYAEGWNSYREAGLSGSR